jgi:hypothetical protein
MSEEAAAEVIVEDVAPAEATEPATDGLATPEQAEQAAEETAAAETPQAKERRSAQTRINELTRARHDAEREAAYWRGIAEASRGNQQQPATQQIEPAKKPTASDFQDYDTYVEALAEWKAEQKVAEALERRQQSTEQARKAAEAREVAKSWSERQNAARSIFADYDAVVGSADVTITPAVSDILLTSDKGPEVAYYLAKNPSVVEKLNALSPTAAAREIGRLEAALEKPSAKHVVDAPQPANVTRSPRTQPSDPAQMDHEAYRAMRAKQGATWARR